MTAANTFLLSDDLRINRLGFGAMRLALGGSVRDPEAAVAVLRRAVELGVNHIDTAGTYGFGDLHAHELIRKALSPYPKDLVIATKVSSPAEVLIAANPDPSSRLPYCCGFHSPAAWCSAPRVDGFGRITVRTNRYSVPDETVVLR